MTDTNNKEETFESKLNKIIYDLEVLADNMQDEFNINSIIERVKQLHDSDIEKKDEEIERLKGIIKLETSQNKENIQNIIRLQAENEKLKDLISKLPEILIPRFGFDDQIDNAKKFTLKIYQEEIERLRI